MSAFEVVTLVVSVIAIALAISSYFRVSRLLERLGRRGQIWFDHSSDVGISDRPVEDDRDAPIPKRPIRGRPE